MAGHFCYQCPNCSLVDHVDQLQQSGIAGLYMQITFSKSGTNGVLGAVVSPRKEMSFKNACAHNELVLTKAVLTMNIAG